MCDTNWCTFCDCAIKPELDSIYCSEKCFQRDAFSYTTIHTKQYDVPALKTLPLLSTSREDYTQSYQIESSNSSICSDDLAAMHLDMLRSSPPNGSHTRRPPSLSFTRSRSNSSHNLETSFLATPDNTMVINQKLSSFPIVESLTKKSEQNKCK
ncbi:hypothetical protein A0J61_00042 [Choanephora cucurbitarum]|uniref:Uncharacterized protein n=1 Tax=Choanephora cucurbitarum TaxID=101091 RepID=A0A1C7NWS7_9FUNG|nr:hypothetical protein A0J61_00042 [Choanephora cucurbitarum]